MIFGDIAIVKHLNGRTWNSLKHNKSVKKILCNKVSCKVDSKKVVTSRRYRVEGGWFSYQQNQHWLSFFAESYLTRDVVNYKNAILKLLFWSNSSTGQLIVGAEKLGATICNANQIKLLYPSGTLKALIKCLFLSLNKKTNVLSLKPEGKFRGKLVFLVKSEADIILWQNLIKTFDKNEIVISNLPETNIDLDELLKSYKLDGYVSLVQQFVRKRIYFRPRLKYTLNRAKANIQLAIFNNLFQMNQYIHLAQKLIQSDCSGVIVNAGENRFESHILEAEFKAVNKPIFNTMNGVKFTTANNAGTDFTKWFVPDIGTKDILLEVGTPEKQISVAGHLMEDDARKHKFSGSLRYDSDFYKQRKVILICTSPSALKEREELLAWIERFNDNDNIYILWKDHPAMDSSLTKRLNVEVLPTLFDKNILYDALLVANCLVVSGSTVALEAMWFNVPTITFEEQEKSLLYLALNGDVTHAKSVKQLEEKIRLHIFAQANVDSQINLENSVAKTYHELIKRYI